MTGLEQGLRDRTDSGVVWAPEGIWGDTGWQVEPRFTRTMALWGLASHTLGAGMPSPRTKAERGLTTEI